MAQKIAKNETFGNWKLKKFLGGGGKGDVWLVVNSKGEKAAMKLLRKIERKTYARFINEVNIIKANSDIEGILPILDSYLPDKPTDETPWYVMPVAQPIEQFLDEKDFEDVVLAIIDVAKTLFELHNRNISHRDIKPENLLVRDGKTYLADFGLVDYPDKINITSSGDVVGAKWTMAPEMRREGSKADGKPADVYSLAKTFWILITKNKKGFDGQYDPTGVNSLNNLSLKEKDRKDYLYIDYKYRPTLFIKCQVSGHRELFYLGKVSRHRELFVNRFAGPGGKSKLIHTISDKEIVWMTSRSFNDGNKRCACVCGAFHTRPFSRRFIGAEPG
jgi:serine/threonine protein kinase